MRTTFLTCAAACLLAVGCATPPATPAPATATAANTAARPPCVGAASASRIPQGNCGPGQTYDQNELQGAGYPGSAADALQTLDPLVHR
jgi:hypothetical protein